MFHSPCSLRSSTCATLIALAAAAGISRIEPAAAKPLAPLQAVIRVLATASRQTFAHTYPISLAACAQPVQCRQSVFSLEAADPVPAAALAGVVDCPASPTLVEAEISFFGHVDAAPTAQKHSYPYAVGPPECGTENPIRAAGNALPGDSPARRSPCSRIAPVFVSKFPALLARQFDSGRLSAESNFLPDSALRSEPEPPLDQRCSPERFSAPDRLHLSS